MKIGIIFALCVLGAFARPHFAPMEDGVESPSARRFVMQETVSRDVEKGEQLVDYDVTLSEHVVLLDQRNEVEEVICNGNELTLVFVKGQQIELTPGQILVGGAEWGCVHPDHDRVVSFNRRILSVSRQQPELDSVTFATENALLTELFAAADVKYRNAIPDEVRRTVIPAGTVIGQATPKQPVTIDDPNPPEEVDAADKRRASDKFVFGDFGNLFFAGDKITVPYSYDNSLATKKFEVCLRKKRLVLDKDISCQTITLSSYGKGEITFTVQSYYEASSAYYIKFDGKGLFAKSYSSDAFGINPAIILLSPGSAEEYYKGSYIDVKWYANADHKNKIVEVSLMKNGIIDKRVQTWQVSLKNPSMSVSIDSLPKGADSGSYYFKMTYSCFVGDLFCDLYDVSDEFSLSRDLPGQKSITISSPSEGDIYVDKNRLLNIKWSSSAMLASDSIRISICRDRNGIDACPYKKVTTTNSGSYSLTVPTSWTGSSNYYVVLQYNCKLFWCSNRESRRFAINYTPKFKFEAPTPAEGEQLTFPTQVTAKFRTVNGATVKRNQVNLRLMRQVPLFEMVHNEASVGEIDISRGSYEQTFSITEGTVFPVRFMVSYDCKFLNYFCQREYSPVFYIPSVYTSGWNYDANTDSAAERKTLFAISCSDGCTPESTNYFCKACNKVPGLQSSIDVACTNCYLATQIKMYDFMLNVNMLGVTGASLAVVGEAKANFDVLVQFDASYAIEKEFELAKYNLIGTSFKIGPININLGASLALNTTLAFSVDGVAKVTAGFDTKLEFKAISSFGGVRGDSNDVKFEQTEFNKHTPVIDLRVNVYGKAGIKPVFDINVVDLLRFWVALHPYVDLTAKFQIPAFNPTGYPDKDSLIKLGVDCDTVDHYSRYDLRVHIEANMYASALKKKEWSSPLWTLMDMSIVSGCLFASKGPLDDQVYTLTKTLEELGYDEESFTIAFVDHIANVVYPGMSASRFAIEYPPVDASNKFAVGTTNIKVTGFQTEDAHENINLKELNGVITNTISKFYQNDFGKSLKGIIGLFSE